MNLALAGFNPNVLDEREVVSISVTAVPSAPKRCC